MDAKSVLYTVGHANHDFDAFLRLLTAQGINAVADVRSKPYSRISTHFNRDNLCSRLESKGIRYVFLGGELGARRIEEECYIEGRADYRLITNLPKFKSG